jgi:hypothetical protein
MPILQDMIHKTEVAGGRRYLKISLAVLAFLMLWVGYNWQAFRNMASQEAMDSAQLGRNIAQGKGYSTLFVRPFSMYLLAKHNRPAAGQTANAADVTRLKTMHPDLANPPIYPLALAGLMKLLPFHYALPTKPMPFWSKNGQFWRYQPDFLIGLFNQIIFFAVVLLVFLLARRLFEPAVAWLSGILLLGTEVLWRFSVSGLSTMLLLLIFMGLIWSLVWVEQEGREFPQRPGRLIVLALLAGALTALGALTRYSFGWVIVPVLLFVAFFSGERRVVSTSMALLAFALIMTPWVVRNVRLCGAPFGTATFAIVENSVIFPEHRLERSLEPDFSAPFSRALSQKLMTNTRQILEKEWPRIGGGWIAAFFLVGLLISFRDPSATRLRYFMMACLILFTIVQALGRTQLSEESPDINSENLLVLVAPLALVYGVSLFHLLISQIDMPMREVRYAAMSLFGLLICLPMVTTFMPPRPVPLAYPPHIPAGSPGYYPPWIQEAARMVKEKEMVMSDIPAGMAWYGERQCVWLTLNPQSDFLAINDYQKPVQELFITRTTLDGRFLSQWVMGADQSWGNFVLESLFRKLQGLPGPPPKFPLHYWQFGWPERFVLTARDLPKGN